MSLAELDTDPSVETEGVWITVHVPVKGPEVRIRVRRAGGANKRYLKAMEHATRPFQRLIQSNAMPNERLVSILQTLYAAHVVVGWENVDLDGEPVDYTPENALAVFNRYPAVWDDVFAMAQSTEAYRADIVEELSKN